MRLHNEDAARVRRTIRTRRRSDAVISPPSSPDPCARGRSGYRVIWVSDPGFVRKSFRKARNFQSVLRGGADGFTMNMHVKSIKKERYVSHRRPAPSEYVAM